MVNAEDGVPFKRSIFSSNTSPVDPQGVALLDATEERSDAWQQQPKRVSLHAVPPSPPAKSPPVTKSSPPSPSADARRGSERRGWAASVLQHTFHRLRRWKRNACAPYTFRTNNPSNMSMVPGLADYGLITFIGRAANRPAHFIHIADSREPYRSSEMYACQVVDLMERHWEMHPASVLISITGSAQDFDLSPRLHQTFSHGLAKASQATQAWIFTGGTDTGVMRLVGRALASFDQRVTTIGICPWGAVLERDKMENCRGERVEIGQTKPNSVDGANIEPHHSHFVMVDNGTRGAKSWGSEIKFRFIIEKEYARRRRVPRVLLVVQGGPGTLQSILEAVMGECPVVLVADSGGVAQALDHFLFRSNGQLPDGKEFDGFRKEAHFERLKKIKERNDIHNKVSSFVLTDSSTAQLDLHLLNAVLNDASQCKPKHRLKLAVQWGRMDVVRSILQENRVAGVGIDTNAVLMPALQMALLKQNAAIISLLVDRKPILVDGLDFISLYQRTPHMLFSMPELVKAFGSEEALQAEGKTTSAEVFLKVMGRWLKTSRLVPGYIYHLDRLVELKKELGFCSLLIWAVLIGNLSLAEIFWQWHAEDHDPIRMALIASQIAKNVARVLTNESKKYDEQAWEYERWACQLLDYCRVQRDAQIVLLRSNPYWPDTIIKLAVQGEHKKFVGHRRVQMLVDDWWNGASLTRELSLPASASTLQIVLYLLLPVHDLAMTEVEGLNNNEGEFGEPAGETAAEARKTEASMSVAAIQRQRQAEGWGCSRFSRGCCRFFSNMGGAFCRRLRIWGTRLTSSHMHAFLGVARVKFTFKFISYIGFLVVYVLVLAQDAGMPQIQLSVLDYVFYTWAFTLLMEELHQWNTAYMRGDSHLDDAWNVMDVISLTLLLVVFLVRVLAVVTCEEPETDVGAAFLEARRGGRALRGGSDSMETTYFPAEAEEEVDPEAQSLTELFEHCRLLAVARVPLALNAFICFFRVLNWLMVWRDIGIISVILIDLYKDIQIFIVILALVVFGFSAALMGLVPALSDSVWSTSGAFFLPYWAMFGEYGELEELSSAALHWGAINWGAVTLWLFNFFSQVLLVNLLIAMMSERYTRIKEEADNEWRFRRVLVIDEFCTSGFALPPPLSLWYTLRISKLSSYLLEKCCCRGSDHDADKDLDTGLLSTMLKTHQSPDHVMLAEMLDAKARAKSAEGEAQRMQNEVERVLTKTLENQELLISIKHATATSEEKVTRKSIVPQPPMLGAQASGPRAGGVGGLDKEQASELMNSMQELSGVLQNAKTAASNELKMKKALEMEQNHNGLLKLELERVRNANLSARESARDLMARKHRRARGPHPLYPARKPVPDEYVDWRVEWRDYAPVDYTSDVVKANDVTKKPNGWADPIEPRSVPGGWQSRWSFEGTLMFDSTGAPVNPYGRTGMRGRGLLGKWGANFAADPIVTRFDPKDPSALQIVAIKRGDTGEWALPGGMVDAGEAVSQAVRREFAEEAGNIQTQEGRDTFNSLAHELFRNGEVVYQGYVDDPRNTDCAWMETTAYHFHCSPDLGALLPLHAGDDAKAVMWINTGSPQHHNLYASHKDWVDTVVQRMMSSARGSIRSVMSAGGETVGLPGRVRLRSVATVAGTAINQLSRRGSVQRTKVPTPGSKPEQQQLHPGLAPPVSGDYPAMLSPKDSQSPLGSAGGSNLSLTDESMSTMSTQQKGYQI